MRYVDVNSANPTPPYTNWATAATNIQDAVDAAVAGDEIVVTNGIYATGSGRTPDFVANRVAVDKPLTLRSVNGPEFTVIDDGGQRSGALLPDQRRQPVRVHLDQWCQPDGDGGGVWCESTNAVLSNCVLSGNSATV